MIWVTLVIANNRNKTLNFREINFIAGECWRRTARRCSTFTLDQSYKEELKFQTETEEGGLLYLTPQLLKNLFYHEKYNGIMQNVATAYAGSPPKKHGNLGTMKTIAQGSGVIPSNLIKYMNFMYNYCYKLATFTPKLQYT